MGQHPAKQSAREQEVERLEELDVLIRQAFQTADALRGPAFDEKARGIPSTPGSKQAQYEAAHKYWRMLSDEQIFIFHRWSECCLSLVSLLSGAAVHTWSWGAASLGRRGSTAQPLRAGRACYAACI